MWGALTGIAGGILGAKAQKDAAEKASRATIEAAQIAARAQIESVEKSIDYQQMYYDQVKEQNLPWTQAGIAALTKIAGTIEYEGDRPRREDFEGPGGEFNQQGYEQSLSQYRSTATMSGGLLSEMPDIAPAMTFQDYDFKSDPGYQAGLEEGVNVLEHAASAKGQLFSGEQEKALMKFGQDYASQKARTGYENYLADYDRAAGRERGQYFDKLGTYQGIAGAGQASAGQVASGGMQMGAIGSQNILAGGQAQAGQALQTGESTAQNILAQGRVAADLYSDIGREAGSAIGYVQQKYLTPQKPVSDPNIKRR